MEEIRQVLEESDFLGEGHRKVRVAQGDLGGQEQGAEAHAREPTPGAGA